MSIRGVLASTLLLLIPAPAFAFSSAGSTATAFIILVLGSFTILNLILNALFFFAGRYQSRRFSKVHSLCSLIIPAIALVLTVIDHRGFADMAFNIGLIIIAVALALLPLQLTLSKRAQSPHGSLILALGALVFLTIAYLFPPVALFSILVAHMALKSHSDNKARIIAFVALIIGYPLMAYWLYQTLQKLIS
ncbi:hypothetical protein [uncultured Shewanella sp.]|uniref:hypothetical protein n=1 Tax=uncultured Shewanella sp. TaxID=173975 RepID=UPI002610ECE0|nr:hypothetical protein [uncultured Shewanella sp.]